MDPSLDNFRDRQGCRYTGLEFARRLADEVIECVGGTSPEWVNIRGTTASGAKRTFREVRQIIERALVSSFHPLLYALPFDLLKQGLVA